MATQNPMCGGGYCTSTTGEVRVLPTGQGSNAILCRACYGHEMRWRRSENRRLPRCLAYPLPRWEDLTTYTGGE